MWNIGSVTTATPVSINITTLVNAPTGVSGEYNNIAEITASDQADPNSTPNNDDGDQSEDDEDNVSITLELADLQITKTVLPISGDVGDTVTFSILLENFGPGDSTGIDIEDLLPSGYDIVPGTILNGGVYIVGNKSIVWNDLTLNNGLSRTLNYDVVINDSGDYTNVAQITGSDLFDPDSTPDNDDGDQSEDDEDDETVTPTQSDLSLVKQLATGSSATPNVGDTVTFEILVSNSGPDDATGVSVSDIVPSGYSAISSIDNGGLAIGNQIDWTGLSITTSGSVTLSYQVTVAAPTGVMDEYKNVAEVTGSDQFDPDSTPDNDDGDQDEDITPLIGTEITFQISITNDGPEDATGVEVTDLLPSGYDFILFSASSGTYNESTGVWNVGTVVNGSTET